MSKISNQTMLAEATIVGMKVLKIKVLCHQVHKVPLKPLIKESLARFATPEKPIVLSSPVVIISLASNALRGASAALSAGFHSTTS